MAHPTAGTDTPPATYTPAGVTSRNPTTPGDLPYAEACQLDLGQWSKYGHDRLPGKNFF